MTVHSKKAITDVMNNQTGWFIVLGNGRNRIPYKGDIMICGKKFANVIDVRRYSNADEIPEYITGNVDLIPEPSAGSVLVAVRIIRSF